jgi:hypothetical protein
MNNVLSVIENWILKNKPTPSPSGEGSSEDEHCTLKNKPTPGPSGEGNLENPPPAPRQGGTGSPGRGTLK